MESIFILAIGFASGIVVKYAVDRYAKLDGANLVKPPPACNHKFGTVLAVRSDCPVNTPFTGFYRECSECMVRQFTYTADRLSLAKSYPHLIDYDWLNGKTPNPKTPQKMEELK